MLKVRIFCAGSMSTALLVRKVQAAAAQAGEEVDVAAHGISSISYHIDDDLDAVLIGPQIASRKDEVKAVCDEHGVPMAVIPITDYGMVNGKKVYELAKKVAATKGLPPEEGEAALEPAKEEYKKHKGHKKHED